MLREFFVNEYPHFIYKPFGLIHNIFTILAFIAAIIIYFNRNKISTIDKDKVWTILKICSCILLLNMIIYTFGNLYFGSFNYKEMLPFHLCFITNYLFMFASFFKKESIFHITIFLSFLGPIPAILWPDLVSTIDNFNFWQLVISHHVFMNISLFSYYALNYHVTKTDLKHTYIIYAILVLISYPLNKHFDTNYIFTNYIPGNVVDLYPFIKVFHPFVIMLIFSFFFFLTIYYIIVYRRNRELGYERERKTKTKRS
jgi:hypothetical integral membrane protein (TIGR02206 family)